MRAHRKLSYWPSGQDGTEAIILNPIIRRTDFGLEYEADPRQVEKLLRYLKLDVPDVKVAATPGVKATKDQHEADVDPGRASSRRTERWWRWPTTCPPTAQSCSTRPRRSAGG